MALPNVERARLVMRLGARTGFLGLSHLGIVHSIGWASFGDPVVAVDLDPEVVSRLRRGDLPVHEPGLPELLERSHSHITFSDDPSDLAACPLVIVAKDVPTDDRNASDLDPVVRLVDAAVPHLEDGVVLVVMSQVPPGFTRSLGERISTIRPDLSFTLVYWVETLVFGDAVRRCLQPERFIVGCADPSAPLPEVFRAGLERYGCPVLPMRYESAELTKTAINLYLIGSVTYANTLADLCERIGADWGEIVPALRLDARIGPAAYLRPSLGIAGGNLERDLVTLRGLSQSNGVDTTYLDALATANERRFGWVRGQIDRHVFARAAEPRIGIWGLTYKKDTRSTKNSPALRLISELAGRAELRAWDPAVGADDLTLPATIVGSRDEVLTDLDGLVVMADWDDFARADLDAIRRRMRRPVVVDAVGVLAGRRAELAGIDYVAMGR